MKPSMMPISRFYKVVVLLPLQVMVHARPLSKLTKHFMFWWIFRSFPDANFDQPQTLLCCFSSANSYDTPVTALVVRFTVDSFSFVISHPHLQTLRLFSYFFLLVFVAMVGESTSTGSCRHESWADTSSVGVCSLLSAVFPGIFPFSHSHNRWHFHMKRRGQKRYWLLF